ncbi:hypothetical protein PIB30_011647 [Stylosanthes scabra]|uniref:Rhamnogalacturonan lyase domain-containing protein n=1 Tax=Stylosanthes scabra TaxID=79078 RepID=A0ABU6W5G3_9FABA|nr:hypothetical protein [Stylosanthes scabra]
MEFWVLITSNEFQSGGPLKQNFTSHVGLITLTMRKQVQRWPYDFLASGDFHKSRQRGTVYGTLKVQDRFISDELILAGNAYVGLAPPGLAGSWQTECNQSIGQRDVAQIHSERLWARKKKYSGSYNVFAWVLAFIGDYCNNVVLTVNPGSKINVGEIVYKPPRDGPTLWEIGIPNRSAVEFYVPDPNPNYVNKLYLNHPERKKDDGSYHGTTWQIKFKLHNVQRNGTYKLRLALATANFSKSQVRVNNPKEYPPMFTSEVIGKDNTIARHEIHGLYRLYNIDISSHLLVKDENIIFLTQTMANGPFEGIMYDYIRLEAPPPHRRQG